MPRYFRAEFQQVQVTAKLSWVSVGFVIGMVLASAKQLDAQTTMHVPDGFQVQSAVARDLVERPMFAALDADGSLFVLDSGGANGNDRRENPSDVLRRLTDTDGDGVYDKSQVFADKIVFGTGLVCYDGAVFLTSPPSLWKFEDTTGDGVADQRTELVTGFAFNQSCTDDVHGACLGPDGRIYFLPGRFHHKIQVPGGPVIREGVGPWLMRCRPDGRDVEIVSGAVGNPVEVAFLPAGDMFIQGTFWAKPNVAGGLRDALIHAVPGGEYSVRDRDYSDRIRTGEFLPALVPFTATAPSGLAAYESDQWGETFRNNLFTSHFNTGKILRHRLTRQGGSFTCETEDFVTAAQGDVHFTDVLEDANGSLLIVDTGGWYLACCPASGSIKPEVKGGIYRVTRQGAPRVEDPFGHAITWDKTNVTELAAHLDDSRTKVRERAILALSKRGAEATAELTNVLKSQASTPRQKRNAVWALCRMESPAARAATRVALHDGDEDVRQAAAHAVALHREAAAHDQITALLRDDSLAVRREAAHALGRIGRSDAVPKLLEAMAELSPDGAATQDRFVEHAFIFALISINDAVATRPGLTADSPAQRRAALIALDQMPLTILGPDDLAPLLSTSDTQLLKAASEVLARHPEWTNVSIQLVDEWLNEDHFPDDRLERLVGMVRVLHADDAMSRLLNRHLANQGRLSLSARRALLLALAKSEVRDVPSAWREGIAEALRSADSQVQRSALQAVESLSIQSLAEDVRRVAADTKATSAIRLAALRSLTVLQQELTNQEFEFLLSHLSPDTPFQESLTALDVVAQAELDDTRLRKLLPLIRQASPVQLPLVLTAFSQGASEEVGREFIKALEASSASPAPELVEQSLRHYGPEILTEARPLLDRLRKTVESQVARLDELEIMIQRNSGDVSRGRELFFGKAQCALCHVVAGRGGKVGPDLSAIGEIRAARGLLEAIVFPSASFARGYEPITVELDDGRVLTGLAGRETSEELVLMVIQDREPVEVPIRRERIEQVEIGRISTMPNGLDRQLEPQELSDLIAYLQQLRKSSAGRTVGE